MLLDLNLPRKKGLKVLQWIRENKALETIPVVVLTASAAASDVRRAYQHGANSYLVKPSDLKRLIEIMQALKLYWLECNQMPVA